MGEPVEVDGEPGAGCEERAEAAAGGSCARLQLGEHHPAGQPPHLLSHFFSFQVGMFWFSGLSEAQGLALADHHVYVMPSKTFTHGSLSFLLPQAMAE